MKSFSMILDSTVALNQTGGSCLTTHEFTTFYHPSLRLDPDAQYEAVLDSLQMSYSWKNITQANNNNKIKWRKTGDSWTTLTFPDVLYDYEQINRYLQKHTGATNPSAEEKDKNYFFNLYFDYGLLRVVIEVEKDYELDLSEGNFADLVGFEKKVLQGDTTHIRSKNPNITRGVDSLSFHCDLISRVETFCSTCPLLTTSPAIPLKKSLAGRSTIQSTKTKLTSSKSGLQMDTTILWTSTGWV